MSLLAARRSPAPPLHNQKIFLPNGPSFVPRNLFLPTRLPARPAGLTDP